MKLYMTLYVKTPTITRN